MAKRGKRSTGDHPERFRWSPRGCENPIGLEHIARDAMKPRQHGKCRSFTQEEIRALEKQMRDSCKT